MFYRAVLAAGLLHIECDIVTELKNRRLEEKVRIYYSSDNTMSISFANATAKRGN